MTPVWTRWYEFSDKELRQIYAGLVTTAPDKMHAQEMMAEIIVEASRRNLELTP
jgi:hypothetical protein